MTPPAAAAADVEAVEVGLAAGYIRPEIAHLAEPLGAVVPYPGNPRRGDHTKIAASLKKHGQYLPLLVQSSTGYIVKGNNTWHVMRDAGYTVAAVQRLDIDDDRAREILLIDNASSDDSDYDKALLAELLAGVADWDAAGWSPDDLDDLLAELGDAGAAVAGLPGAPTVLPEVPATDAQYSEDPDAEAARQERFDSSTMLPTKNLEEMVLLLPGDDRAEAVRLIASVRGWLGAHLSAGEVVLRALRTLTAAGDSRHSPDAALPVAALLRAADYTDTPQEEVSA